MANVYIMDLIHLLEREILMKECQKEQCLLKEQKN